MEARGGPPMEAQRRRIRESALWEKKVHNHGASEQSANAHNELIVWDNTQPKGTCMYMYMSMMQATRRAAVLQ